MSLTVPLPHKKVKFKLNEVHRKLVTCVFILLALSEPTDMQQFN